MTYRHFSFVALLLTVLAIIADDPAPDAWGKANGGLQSLLTVAAPVQAKTSCRLQLTVRNAGDTAVLLPAREQVGGWLFVGQGSQRSFYSEHLKWPAAEPREWPKELPAGKTLTVVFDLASTSLFRFPGNYQLEDGYPKTDPKTKPAGRLQDLLDPSRPAALSLILRFPGADGKAVSVSSNSLTVEVAAPKLADLPAAEREAYSQQLVDRFCHSAASAKDATEVAVALGPQITARLVPPALNPETPEHSRMWLATALAGIGDEAAVNALVKLVNDPQGSVRNVVAYHGPKVKAKDLDTAILTRAMKPGDGDFTAWAIRGFTTFRGQAPRELLEAGLKSTDRKVRVGAIVALGRNASKADVTTLIGLLRDSDVRIQAAAAAALATANSRETATLKALAAALNDADTYVAMHLIRALDKLTDSSGKQVFNENSDADTRAKVIEYWQGWARTVLKE